MFETLGTGRDRLSRHASIWQRAAVIIGVLALSAILASAASHSMQLQALFLLLALSAVIVFLRWPALGLAIVAVGGMIIPFRGPGDVNATILLLVLLLCLWIVDMVVRRRKVQLAPSATTRPLFLLVVAVIISFIAGQLSWFTYAQQAPIDAQVAGLTIFVLSPVAFLLAANQITDLRQLQKITWVFLTVASLYIVGRIVPGAWKVISPLYGRGDFGSVLIIWVASLAFSQAVFNRKLHLRWRLMLAILTASTAYFGFVVSYSNKAAWMPLFLSIAAIITIRSWRAGLAMALLGALPAWYLTTEALARDAYSVSTRYDAFVIMLEIIKVSPILGLGPANYRYYTPLYRISGYNVAFNSHNNYADIAAQTGLLGLASVLWFFWEIARLSWWLRDRAPTGFARAYVYGAFGGLVGMAVAAAMGDWILPFVYNIGVGGFRSAVLGWLFLGGLVVIERQVRESDTVK